jgi:hypothetical protein
MTELLGGLRFFRLSLTCDRWFSPGTPVSSTNKTDRHELTEILLKVALNTITPSTSDFFPRG